MNTSMPAPTSQRPPLRRLLAAALAGGLGVFGIAVDPSSSAAQAKSTPSALTANSPAQRQPGS